ncbi:hypothetical protein [Mesorhizobium sp. BH1-1-4]|uniref:hypothetical protein n=1 Tax=Mesorhizobium sp. BH1-1-4 TaxID=2876662 RepID=UPI0029623850|nr:hypothetical protein [Mesorhizobium sp. BH1-1-4]
MKTDVAKAELVVRPAHLRLPIRAQGERRVAATDRMFPEVGEFLALDAEIAAKSCPWNCLKWLL